MKKRILILGLVFVVLFIVICFVIINIKQNSKAFKVLSIQKTYNYVNTYDEIGELDIDLYINNKNAFILERKSAGNCYLKSENESLEIKLLNIIDKDESIKFNGESYYLYKFKFNIPLKTDSDIEFSFLNANLEMNYPEEVIELNIGSFYYLKVKSIGDSQNKLLLPKIRPIVNSINNNKTLVGLNIAFENLKDDEITITNVKLLTANSVLSSEEYLEIEEDYSSSESINTILGYNYDLEYLEESNITFKVDDSKEFIFPVKYKNNYIIDKAGILIEYKVNGNLYRYYINEFLFFSATKFNINESNYKVNSYGNK